MYLLTRLMMLLGQKDGESKSPGRRPRRTLEAAVTRHRRTSPSRSVLTLQSNLLIYKVPAALSITDHTDVITHLHTVDSAGVLEQRLHSVSTFSFTTSNNPQHYIITLGHHRSRVALQLQ